MGDADQGIGSRFSGQEFIRFAESDIREMGRTAAGVKAMKLGKDDNIVGADSIKKTTPDAELLVMGRNGFGKKTPIKDYKIQKRGGSGIKTINLTGKTGDLISSRVLAGEESEIVAISKLGQIIRTGLDEIPSLGRQTQGVRIMKLRADDSLASITCL